MRVLITNNRLDHRGGAESFVRDLARGLQELGHSVLAYSSDTKQSERLLESDLIPVATDLEKLPFSPDIIHAQHHLDAMTAINALPGVPAVYHCHGAVWNECPPQHPRIHRYISMSATLADRMSVESGIKPENIDVVLNSVELDRFRTIRELPARPLRALIYNKLHSERSETYQAIREAVTRCGMELDCIGQRFGMKIPHPEQTLPGYDIVFASGRSAIDAMASGCAVVVLGRTSCGPLVTPENYERLRRVNFSIAVNSPPPCAEKIAAEIQRYQANECAGITRRLREDADSRVMVKSLLSIYEKAIDTHRHTAVDLEAELRATSRYLRKVVPLIKMADKIQKEQGISKLSAAMFDELHGQLTRIEDGLRDVF